jgi:penicillin-binding protein 2B
MSDSLMTIAAKTGTAETTYVDDNGVAHETVNSNVIAYGPYEDPEIAVSVILPNLNNNSENFKNNQYMAKAVINAYVEMYKQ